MTDQEKPQMTPADFLESTTEETRELVLLLEWAGRMSQGAITSLTGISGKSLGGRLGCLCRWAKVAGLQPPVVVEDPLVGGKQRTYLWRGWERSPE